MAGLTLDVDREVPHPRTSKLREVSSRCDPLVTSADQNIETLRSNSVNMYMTRPPHHFVAAHDQNWRNDTLMGRDAQLPPASTQLSHLKEDKNGVTTPRNGGSKAGEVPDQTIPTAGGRPPGPNLDDEGLPDYESDRDPVAHIERHAPERPSAPRSASDFSDVQGGDRGAASWWRQPSDFNSLERLRAPVNRPPREWILREGGPSIPNVTAAVLTPTEQARLQDSLFNMRNARLRRVYRCPFSNCRFIGRMDDPEATVRHTEEQHTPTRCPWCDNRFYQFMDQHQRDDHFVQSHWDRIAALASTGDRRQHKGQRAGVRPADDARASSSSDNSPLSPPALRTTREIDPGAHPSLPPSPPMELAGRDLIQQNSSRYWNVKLGTPPQDFSPEPQMMCSRCFRKAKNLTRRAPGDPTDKEQMLVSIWFVYEG